jgi:hypothetical protein
VRADLDDLVTALYVVIDDLIGPNPRPGPGRRPRLSDSELVCLAVAQVLLGFPEEARWLRFCYCRLGHLFPYLPNQPGYNKRLRGAGHLRCLAIRHLAMASPGWSDAVRLLDATPLPCGASRQTAQRSDLWGLADDGWCASHSRWYWGLKLDVLSAPDGTPINWCLATPKLGDREVAQALLADCHTTVALGRIIVADKGFAGAAFEQTVAALGATLLRPDRTDEPRRFGSLGGMRQWIESIIDTLKGQLSLERHGGRTRGGVYARVAQRLLALAACVWFNWLLGEPDKRSLVAYDH